VTRSERSLPPTHPGHFLHKDARERRIRTRRQAELSEHVSEASTAGALLISGGGGGGRVFAKVLEGGVKEPN